MGDVILVRHGETEWTVTGQHTSWTDLPLTRRGEEQAKTMTPFFAAQSFGLVLTSPLHRAVRTAELAGLAGAQTDLDLHEWDYGAYEGLTTREIHRTRPDWVLWYDGVPPGPDGHPGESPAEVGVRADRVLSRVDAALCNHPGDVVLVAHGHFLRVLTARRLGLPPDAGRYFQLATGTISRLSTEHGNHVIASWNEPGTFPGRG